jgi:hypothetical protein
MSLFFRYLHIALGVALLATTGCALPPWPIGDASPGLGGRDDDDDDGDDESSDDDSDDDDSGPDDDDSAPDDDDDNSPGDDDDFSPADDDSIDPDDPDGDGYPNGLDCEDNDPDIYPGAPETPCDGVDQDCNGQDLCNVCVWPAPADHGTISDIIQFYDGELDSGDPTYGSGLYYYETHRFQAGTTGSYTISLNSSEFDAFMEVRNADCGQIAVVDDGDNGSNPSWTGLFAVGDVFFVVASSAYAFETGDYDGDVVILGI